MTGGRPSIAPLLCRSRRAKLDLSSCTPFQKKIYRTLRNVPAGRKITYGDLARRAGHPGAARAVGSAMNRNPLPVVIPCHRVVPATGGIGHYSVGVAWKRFLLSCEGVL
ncbi:MAG TPA: MGMT family protein, partial [Candidatus Omnitrophota bacterium]|nr:MGMT family protein [Candidatus Omnitrophota bacterium]